MSDTRRHLAVVREQHGGDLEKACVHCAACCHASVPINGRLILVKALRCKFLRVAADGKSQCSVYADRAARAPWCKSLEIAIDDRLFPDPCPYVRGLDGYEGPAILDEIPYRLIEDRVIGELRRRPMEPWANPAEWNAYVHGVIR